MTSNIMIIFQLTSYLTGNRLNPADIKIMINLSLFFTDSPPPHSVSPKQPEWGSVMVAPGLSGICHGQTLQERKWDRGMRGLKALTGKRHDAPEALGAVVGDGGGGRARS